MYIPASFAEHDLNKLHDAIERHSFALLISGHSGDLVASHLPLLLDRTAGPRGTLLGHMARANDQWKSAAGRETLAVFSGPHAYISPTWYAAPQTVPTWNYIAVHAYGRLTVIDDPAQTIALLERTIEKYESGQPNPWRIAEPHDFTARLAAQIVAFQIPIERLEGKWKLNQNRPVDQRARVIDHLRQMHGDNEQAIAHAMAAAAPGEN